MITYGRLREGQPCPEFTFDDQLNDDNWSASYVVGNYYMNRTWKRHLRGILTVVSGLGFRPGKLSRYFDDRSTWCYGLEFRMLENYLS